MGDINKKYPLPARFGNFIYHDSRAHGYKKKYDYSHSNFSRHLEIERLKGGLFSLVNQDFHSTHISKYISNLIENLEPNPEKIRGLQSISKYILSNQRLNRALCSLEIISLGSVNCDFDDELDESDGRSPLSIFLDYSSNIDRVLNGLEDFSKNDFFDNIKNQFEVERQIISEVKEKATHLYSLRADLFFNITKSSNYGRKKESYQIEFLDGTRISITEEGRGDHASLKFKSKKKNQSFSPISISILGATIYQTEIESSLSKSISSVLKSHKSKMENGETASTHLIIETNQTGIGKYSTKAHYTINHRKNTLEGTIESSGGGGFAFIELLKQKENSKLKKAIAPIIARVEHYNPLFENLKYLGRHAQIAHSLSDLGAQYPTISDNPSDQVQIKKMRCPLLVLANKKVVPNDVEIKDGHHLVIATGANLNGKSTYGISIAQSCILAQAGFPIFCEDALIYPRSSIISKFPDYHGIILQNESRHSADCSELASILKRIDKDSLLILDELGTGTAPSDAIETLYQVFSNLAKLKRVSIFASTHYHELVSKLFSENKEVVPIAFNFDNRKIPIFRASPGIAKTSEGTIIASRNGLSKRNLESYLRKWEKLEIVL